MGPRIAPIPKKALTRLLTLQEPERSFQWLQSLSEEDPEGEIIQIALWAAYQPCFDKADVPLLRAADFIKNLATTLPDNATLQVISGADKKYVIRAHSISSHSNRYEKQ